MTLVKFNQKPIEKTINNLFDDFFTHLPNRFFDDLGGVTTGGYAPVNIRETNDSYEMEIVSPGMEKSDFKINVDREQLTVSAEKKKETKNENERQVRREFNYKSFTRTFTLDNSIDAGKIAARYENGVLFLTLPKKEEVKVNPKEISIQ
jgi:HSP20 family protein